LSKYPPVELPPSPEVWPRLESDARAMAEQFTKELVEVHGEVIQPGTSS